MRNHTSRRDLLCLLLIQAIDYVGQIFGSFHQRFKAVGKVLRALFCSAPQKFDGGVLHISSCVAYFTACFLCIAGVSIFHCWPPSVGQAARALRTGDCLTARDRLERHTGWLLRLSYGAGFFRKNYSYSVHRLRLARWIAAGSSGMYPAGCDTDLGAGDLQAAPTSTTPCWTWARGGVVRHVPLFRGAGS
ncbi:hypothetical protein [Terasakiella pusilla]|uniref:hypothetical protein n=1 Tax=Terasakiella pusilla TaxID=64973 RepID=UPI003AA987FF